MIFRFLTLVSLGLIGALLSNCATSLYSTGNPTSAAWKAYIHESPFSYSTTTSVKVVANLASNINRISLDGVDPHVAAHIRKAERWSNDYPVYLERATAAAQAAYERGKSIEKPMRIIGKYGGRELADQEGDSTIKRYFGGIVGDTLARCVNEAYSQSSANAAGYRIMAPLMQRGKELAFEEHEINRSLDLPTTDHLRHIIGAF